MNPRHTLTVLSVALLALAAPLAAQVERYELGLRLRASERRLAAHTDPAQRRAALQEFERAVQSFFRLDLGGVARALDAADRALGAGDADNERLAASLQLVASQRLADANGAAVRFTLTKAYDAELEPPAGMTLQIGLADREGWLCDRAVDTLPLDLDLPLRDLGAGDRTLRWQLRLGERVLTSRTQGLSLANELDARLARLDAAIATSPADASVDQASLRHLDRLLHTMTRRRGEETVLPGEHLLIEAEAIAEALTKSHSFHGPAQPGQHWLCVPTGKSTTVLRLLVPPDTDAAAARPLVLALHGAGGSENLFFDGYGDGAIVALCAARGWYLAAPRCGAGSPDLTALVDALAATWPIDTKRVLLIGHSMGAMLAVTTASRTPNRFAAAAALGGGGPVRASLDLKRLPFFVGIGSRDFLADSAKSLRDSLDRAGVPFTFREYPDVEHLTVVQFALPEVFAFFDAALAKH